MRRVVSIEIAWSKILFNLNTLGWWLARTFWTGHKYFYLRGSLTLPADGKPSLDKMILTSACSCTLSLCVYCDLYGCTKKNLQYSKGFYPMPDFVRLKKIIEKLGDQCDQIGRFFKVFGNTFSYKSSPNIWWLLGLFWKMSLFE